MTTTRRPHDAGVVANRPSLEDPLVTAASEVIGGPIGPRARPHGWWTPVRVVLAVACIAYLLGMLQKTPCVLDDWSGADSRYAQMCYSDVPYLYSGRGFAERVVPFSDTDGRYPALEYPVVIGYFAYGAAVVTHALKGWPDLEERKSLPDGEVFRAPGVGAESNLFFVVNAVLLAFLALLAAGLMAGAHRGRPWDAMAYAAAPTLVLTGLINWDYLAICCLAGAMFAWSRGRPLLSGALVGVGVATKLYPLFLLGALFVVCVRRRELPAFVQAASAAVVAWFLMNAPPMLYGFDQWKQFWVFNQDRGADLGSLWLVWQQSGHQVDAATINVVSEVFFGAVCVGVLILGLLARRTPRIPQLAFLILVGFLVVNKVYSPQYVMWLLPLAVLARPRWRDLLVWQAAEIFYFAAVWLYLGHFTEPATSGTQDHVYWLAIVVRVLGELWLAGVVVRDVLRPWHDPVRADGVTDDPMHPPRGLDRLDRPGGRSTSRARAG